MVQAALLIAGLLLLLFAALMGRRALRVRRLRARLQTLGVTPIAATPDGLVLVQGVVRVTAPTTSPFQKRACAYYAYRIEDAPESFPKPRRLAVGKDWGDLWVEDSTGRVQVTHRSAMIQAPRRHVKEFGRLFQIPPEHAEFFEAAGINPKHIGRFQNLRVIEYTLEDGDDVHLLGTLATDGESKTFYRAKHSPLAVSQTSDAGLIPGLRNESLLFSVGSVLVAVFALLFLGLSLA